MLSVPDPTSGQSAGANEQVAQTAHAIESSQVRELYRANRVGEIARLLSDPEKQAAVAAALEQTMAGLCEEFQIPALAVSEQINASFGSEVGRFSVAREIAKTELASKDEVLLTIGSESYNYDSIVELNEEIGESFRRAVDRGYSQMGKSSEYLEVLTRAAAERGSASVVIEPAVVSRCLKQVYGSPENYLLSRKLERETMLSVFSYLAEEVPDSTDREMIEEMARAFKGMLVGLQWVYDTIDRDFLDRYWNEASEEVS